MLGGHFGAAGTDAVVPEPPAVSCCESAGGAADGAIAFRMALSVVMSKRKREAGLEMLLWHI